MAWLWFIHLVCFILSGWFLLVGVWPTEVSRCSAVTRFTHITVGLLILVAVINSATFFFSHIPK